MIVVVSLIVLLRECEEKCEAIYYLNDFTWYGCLVYDLIFIGGCHDSDII